MAFAIALERERGFLNVIAGGLGAELTDDDLPALGR